MPHLRDRDYEAAVAAGVQGIAATFAATVGESAEQAMSVTPADTSTAVPSVAADEEPAKHGPRVG